MYIDYTNEMMSTNQLNISNIHYLQVYFHLQYLIIIFENN